MCGSYGPNKCSRPRTGILKWERTNLLVEHSQVVAPVSRVRQRSMEQIRRPILPRVSCSRSSTRDKTTSWTVGLRVPRFLSFLYEFFKLVRKQNTVFRRSRVFFPSDYFARACVHSGIMCSKNLPKAIARLSPQFQLQA